MESQQIQELNSEKDWLVTLLLAIFLGPLGIDRFYAGRIVLGIVKLLTFGFFLIWWAVDIVFVITEIYKDGNGINITKN
jgi:TM2 domain-containing membrane protein YozV